MSDFQFWLNSNIIVSSEGFKTPQKVLFLHIFLRDSRLLFVLNKWRRFQQQKSLTCFGVVSLNNTNNYFCLQDNSILLCSEPLRNNFFSWFKLIFWNLDRICIHIFNIQHIKSTFYIIFLSFFPVIFSRGKIHSLLIIFIYERLNFWYSLRFFFLFSMI